MNAQTLLYGKKQLALELPAGWQSTEIRAPAVAPAPDALALVNAALDQPLGGRGLEDFRGVSSACIAVNDKTRPVPHAVLLPPLLARLEDLGLQPEQISLAIATGTHPAMVASEFEKILPPAIIQRYPVFSHDANDLTSMRLCGETARQTPIWINSRYLDAELRIVVGDIEPHQFQGFSGGVKSAAIGLAGRATIEPNHALMTHPNSRLGEYENNPARQEVEEIGRQIGIHFALNAILNQHKELVSVLAGDPQAVMLAGIPLARRICQVQVAAPFDLVIASAGGYPKDINLYQAQKSLAHAAMIVRPGGALILVAACPEGTGSRSYEAWMAEGVSSFTDVFARFEREGFRVGPHKAWQIARDASRVFTVLVSEMDPDFVRSLLLTPAAHLEQAFALIAPRLPAAPQVGVLPFANNTIPLLESQPA